MEDNSGVNLHPHGLTRQIALFTPALSSDSALRFALHLRLAATQLPPDLRHVRSSCSSFSAAHSA